MKVLFLLLSLASAIRWAPGEPNPCPADQIAAVDINDAMGGTKCESCPSGQTAVREGPTDKGTCRTMNQNAKKAAEALQAGDRAAACEYATKAVQETPGDNNALGMQRLACDKRKGNFELDKGVQNMKRHEIGAENNPGDKQPQAQGQQANQGQMGNFGRPQPGQTQQPGGFDPLSGDVKNGKQFDEAAVGVPQVPLGTVEQPVTSYDKTQSAQDDINRGRYADAAIAAQDAITLDPKNVRAHVILAAALEAGDRHAEALAAADKGLALAPQNVNLLKAKSKAMAKTKDFDGAVAAADAALAVNPTDPSANVFKAYALGLKGDKDGMLNVLKTAAALDPSYERLLLQAQNGGENGQPFILPGDQQEQPDNRRQVIQRKVDPKRNVKIAVFFGGLAVLFIIAGLLIYNVSVYRSRAAEVAQAPDNETANTPGA